MPPPTHLRPKRFAPDPPPPPARAMTERDFQCLPHFWVMAAIERGNAVEARRWLDVIAALRRSGFYIPTSEPDDAP